MADRQVWVLCSGRKGKVAGRMALETLLAKPPGRLIVVCMPPYNEEYAIASVIIKTQKYFSKVVVCDDGSEDQTGELAALLVTDMIRDRQKKGEGLRPEADVPARPRYGG